MRKKIFFTIIILLFTLLSGIFYLCAFAKNKSSYETFLFQHDFYRNIVIYFRYAKEVIKEFTFDYNDLLLMIIVDLPFSLLCLWLALYSLPTRQPYEFKNYIWFLFAINIGRFIGFLFFKGVWMAIEGVVINFKPHWRLPFTEAFYLYVILSWVIVYIWLLARTFKLSAFGAARTFVISHLIYCSVVYAFVLFVPDKRIASFVNKNMGLRTIVQSYILDVDKIAQRAPFLSLIRIKSFHM